MSNQWQHGVCGCFDNCGVCIISYIIPCYVFGKNAEAVGESCIMCGVLFLIPVADIVSWVKVRGMIREKRGIDGSCFGDVMMIICCPLCSLVQERQEVLAMTGEGMAVESIERE